MAFCPECGREYPPGVVACRDCRLVLSEEAPRPSPGPVPVDWEALCPVDGLVEGQMLKGALESQGLHPRLVSFDVPAYAGVRWDWSRGDWGELRVPADELLEARAVLGDFLKAVQEIRLEGEPLEGEGPGLEGDGPDADREEEGPESGDPGP